MRLKKSQGQIEAIGNMASTLKPDAKKSVQANVKAIYGHLDNAIAKIRASSKISKANIDAINADLIKEINKAVADVKVKLEKQKSAEEQERLRKIQEVKFIYTEKATKFCEIFPLLLTVCTVVKSKGKISQNFVAFSEYMNFKKAMVIKLPTA